MDDMCNRTDDMCHQFNDGFARRNHAAWLMLSEVAGREPRDMPLKNELARSIGCLAC